MVCSLFIEKLINWLVKNGNEDILRIMKNIDKTIPYDNIREANKVYNLGLHILVKKMFYLGLSDNISVVEFEIRVNIDDNPRDNQGIISYCEKQFIKMILKY